MLWQWPPFCQSCMGSELLYLRIVSVSAIHIHMCSLYCIFTLQKHEWVCDISLNKKRKVILRLLGKITKRHQVAKNVLNVNNGLRASRPNPTRASNSHDVIQNLIDLWPLTFDMAPCTTAAFELSICPNTSKFYLPASTMACAKLPDIDWPLTSYLWHDSLYHCSIWIEHLS